MQSLARTESAALKSAADELIRAYQATPELLEALDFMVNVSRATPGFSPMARKQAERALANARGGA